MGGLPYILSLFCNEFNKFNNTRARMLDSIYHDIIFTFHFKLILSLRTPHCYGCYNVPQKLVNH